MDPAAKNQNEESLAQIHFLCKIFYLSLFMRTASIEVKKFSFLRAAPVFVLNKQRQRGDKDGCCSQKQQKLVMSK